MDVRELEGRWAGQRIGSAAVLDVGFPAGSQVELELDSVDVDALHGRLTIASVIEAAPLMPIPGAAADVLASLTHTGSPAKVQLGFVDTVDGGGPATVVVSVYDETRIELRVLRGGIRPLYGVFRLDRR